MKIKREVIISGGGGFIGSHLADIFLKNEYDITIIDNFMTGQQKNINPKISKIININCGDISESFIGRKSIVIHCAAKPYCSISTYLPEEDTICNYVESIRFLKRCIKSKVDLFVFISSMSVYGDALPLPYKETMDPKPKDPYAINKFAFEKICISECIANDIDYLIIRPQNVFGIRQRGDLGYRNVIPRWIKRALLEKKLPVFGSLNIKRAFSPITLITRSIFALVETYNARNQIFNVGSNNVRPLEEIGNFISKYTGKKITYEYLSSPCNQLEAAFGITDKLYDICGIKENNSEFEDNLCILIQSIEKSNQSPKDIIPSPELLKTEFHKIYKQN